MKDMFAQGGSGSAGIKTNKQAIARACNVKVSEVIYSNDTITTLDGKKVIYDKPNQYIWGLPSGIPSGATVVSVTGSTLVYNPGGISVQLTDLISAVSLKEDLTNVSGDALVKVQQPYTGSLVRTQHSFNADYVSLRDFGTVGDVAEIGTGNAEVDTAAITKAFASGHLNIDFLNLNLKVNNWFILPQGIRLRNCGVIEQTLWGYPVFEQRYPDAHLQGRWTGKYLGDRTGVISSNTLGYSYVTSGDWKAYGSFIWQNYYEGRDISGLRIDSLDVYGFIAGIWFTGADAQLGACYFDTVDFGVFGVVKDNQRIESIYHKNITASQGHEGHALYTNGTGKGLYCGPVYVEGSPLACSPVKIHTTKNFRIESISGVGLATIAYFMGGATGSVGSVNCICDVNANFTGPGQDPSQYNILALDTDTRIQIGDTFILADQQASVKPNAIQASGGGQLDFVGKFKYRNVNTTVAQPSVLLLSSSGSASFCEIEIEHPNSTCTNYMFNLLSYSSFYVATPPKVTINSAGTVLLLRNTYASTNNYDLSYDPSLIFPAPVETSITCTSSLYFGVRFRGSDKNFRAITGQIPIMTHTNHGLLTNTSGTTMTRVRYLTPGQEVTIYNSDGNTIIGHNSGGGLDGNIISPTGANIPAASWKFATFVKMNGSLNAYLVKYA